MRNPRSRGPTWKPAPKLVLITGHRLGPELTALGDCINPLAGEPSSTQVSEEHNSGFVGNHEFRAGLKCDRLWRDPAGPKNRNLIMANRHRLAVVRSIQIDDPIVSGLP